jgi:hypothetical protein
MRAMVDSTIDDRDMCRRIPRDFRHGLVNYPIIRKTSIHFLCSSHHRDTSCI